MLENNYTSWLEALFQKGENPYLQNHEALDYLKKIQSWYNAAIAGGGGALIAGAVAAPPIGLVGGLVSLTIIELSLCHRGVIKNRWNYNYSQRENGRRNYRSICNDARSKMFCFCA